MVGSLVGSTMGLFVGAPDVGAPDVGGLVVGRGVGSVVGASVMTVPHNSPLFRKQASPELSASISNMIRKAALSDASCGRETLWAEVPSLNAATSTQSKVSSME